MPKTKKPKPAMFYEFKQNNPGGRFIEKYGYAVFVEATSAEEANKRAELVGISFDGVRDGSDCPCCGDRWYSQWRDDRCIDESELAWCIEERVKYGKQLDLPFVTVIRKGSDELVRQPTLTKEGQ